MRDEDTFDGVGVGRREVSDDESGLMVTLTMVKSVTEPPQLSEPICSIGPHIRVHGILYERVQGYYPQLAVRMQLRISSIKSQGLLRYQLLIQAYIQE